jgi:hypothetical protein
LKVMGRSEQIESGDAEQRVSRYSIGYDTGYVGQEFAAAERRYRYLEGRVTRLEMEGLMRPEEQSDMVLWVVVGLGGAIIFAAFFVGWHFLWKYW